MDQYKYIYSHQAKKYHKMILSEDTEGNIFRAIGDITSLQGKLLLDLGTGTGRLPMLVNCFTASTIGLDRELEMLNQAQSQMAINESYFELLQGDIRSLPLPTAKFDICTAGWVIGHFTEWFTADWREQIRHVLEEIYRVVKTNGVIIFFETLGTGSVLPTPPTPELEQYYAYLEDDWGFMRRELSTDYQFDSVNDAIFRTEFFFGPELASKIRQNDWSRVPEWTGMWYKIVMP